MANYSSTPTDFSIATQLLPLQQRRTTRSRSKVGRLFFSIIALLTLNAQSSQSVQETAIDASNEPDPQIPQVPPADAMEEADEADLPVRVPRQPVRWSSHSTVALLTFFRIAHSARWKIIWIEVLTAKNLGLWRGTHFKHMECLASSRHPPRRHFCTHPQQLISPSTPYPRQATFPGR